MTDEKLEVETGMAEQPAAVEEATAPPTIAEEVKEPTDMFAREMSEHNHEQDEKNHPMDYSHTFRSLSPGDVVQGVVVHIDKEGVLVDIGTKSEGIIRPNELTNRPVQSMEDVVSVGETIEVYVIQPENDEGYLVLSKKRADFEKAWERVQQSFEEGKTVTAMVTDRVKGGLVVDLGIRGFIPGSHVGSGNVKNLDKYVGQSLPLKVIEVDRERRKVVLSHRQAADEERSKLREQLVETLKEGEIREGIVRRVTDYGAFVDLGGIDGLLHVSEMSWTRIGHPSDVVKVGQKIQVMVLKLNLDAGRVSLGLRQILPDPWAEVGNRWRVGDIITGAISRLVPFGAFVQLDQGIEAIIPNSELSHRKVKRPEDAVEVGQEVQAKVIDVRPEERRMTLSMKQIQEDTDREEFQSYHKSSSRNEPTRMTLGDLLGDRFQELGLTEGPAKSKKGKKPAREAVVAEEPAEIELEEPVAKTVEVEAPVVETAPEIESAAEVVAEVEPVVEETASEAAAEDAPEAEKPAES
jgi:4-hydroxy-3-methylbut-2-enyl diphosphate reductase